MKITQFFKYNGLLIAYLIAALFIVFRNYYMPWGDLFEIGGNYSHYNNYLIFKQSFIHLVNQTNLYQLYPQEHYDLYKYPPIFAMFMAPFYALPVFPGYLVWTILNVFLPIYALKQLGILNSTRNKILLLAILPEAITAALNSQSNGLVVGLLILSVDALFREKTFFAILWIFLSAYIKIFGLLFLVLFLFFPNQIRKGFSYGLVVFFVFLLLPAIFGGIDVLLWQYKNWLQLLQNDHQNFVKYSVMGWIQSWFKLHPGKNVVMFAGLLIQLLPIIFKWKIRTDRFFVITYAASLLVWMVIFNHMAESATFIIAVLGIYCYLASQNKWTPLQWILLILVVAFTILGPTDIYPANWRDIIVKDLQLKVFPCIAFWFYLQFLLFSGDEFQKSK